MSRTSFNISMPSSMCEYVENKVSVRGYGSVSEYIRELIRRDQQLEIERRDTSFQRYRGNPEPRATESRDAPTRTPLASASRRYPGHRGR